MSELGDFNSLSDFFAEWNNLLGYTVPEHHIKMLKFLHKTVDSGGGRGVILAFRHSGKSTVLGCFVAWCLSVRPEMRVLIFSAEAGLSGRMVAHIKNIIENHPKCEPLIPKQKKEWASDRITVNRKIGIREPSVICQGLYGNITGLRADLIICDDIEVPNTANTAGKRRNLRERLRELDFILSPSGSIIYIGTPHTEDTIYQVSEKK